MQICSGFTEEIGHDKIKKMKLEKNIFAAKNSPLVDNFHLIICLKIILAALATVNFHENQIIKNLLLFAVKKPPLIFYKIENEKN